MEVLMLKPIRSRMNFHYRIDDVSLRALYDLKPSTRTVYKFYIERIMRKFKLERFSEVTKEQIITFSKNYSSPNIVRRILLSFLKRVVFDYGERGGKL